MFPHRFPCLRHWPLMALLLALAPGLYADFALGQTSETPALRIEILEGEGAINNVRQRTAREPIVRVVDRNNRPVAGAAVLFLLPQSGAGGSFSGGAKVLNVITNQQGVAAARGLQLNTVVGEFQIRVTASYQGQTATAAIAQTNSAAAAGAAGAGGAAAGAGGGLSTGAVVGIVAAVAGAAIGVALGVGGGGGGPAPVTGPPPTPTIGVSLGSPTVATPAP